jgi:polyhydroxybutyrate depolymerase
MRRFVPPSAPFFLLLACAHSANDTPPDAAPPAADASAVARPSSGCATPSARYRAGTQPGELQAGGQRRTFLVHLPTGYQTRTPAPLVLLLHGGVGTGAQMEGSSLFSPIADREGVVAVYPDGVSRAWNAGGCCGPPAEQQLDDVGFMADLLDHLEGELCLDRRRVYATGMSNGAMMAHRLGCDLSDRIAAIAPVAGTNMTATCVPRRPVPVLHIHGSADKHVPWMGGMGCGIAGVPYTSVPDSVAGWVTRNGCNSAAPALYLEQGDGRCERQASCPAGADVILCTIAGGGHSWPGGDLKETQLPACRLAGEGEQSRTFLASEQVWAFFRTQVLP